MLPRRWAVTGLTERIMVGNNYCIGVVIAYFNGFYRYTKLVQCIPLISLQLNSFMQLPQCGDPFSLSGILCEVVMSPLSVIWYNQSMKLQADMPVNNRLFPWGPIIVCILIMISSGHVRLARARVRVSFRPGTRAFKHPSDTSPRFHW
jgi:hypothetical protein